MRKTFICILIIVTTCLSVACGNSGNVDPNPIEAVSSNQVKELTSEEMDAIEFNSIWACSSILHLPRLTLSEVFMKMATALKGRGVVYEVLNRG